MNLAGITIGLQQPRYTATEGDEVEVCIEAIAGNIGRDFIVSLVTTDITATVNGTVTKSLSVDTAQ